MICINTKSEQFLLYHVITLNSLKSKILKFLDLPNIRVEYTESHLSQYKWDYIKIGYAIRAEYYSMINDRRNINIKTYLDGLIFALCHELGHHFHVVKHKKWTKEFLKSYDNNLEREEYSKQRIEQVANNIAKILLKKFHPQVLTK